VFFGAAWGMPALGGAINVSGALALLRGTWSNDSATNPYNNTADATLGFSFNAGYTYRFGRGWGVTGDYRFQRYNYAFNQYTTGATTNPGYDVTEKISSIGVRVSYEF